MRFVLVIFILLIGMSCSSKSDIIELEVIYYKPNVSMHKTVHCSDIIKENQDILKFYKRIGNTHFINEFEALFNTYTPRDSVSHKDMRIKILIHYDQKDTKTLCLGEDLGTSIDNKPMNDSKKLLDLLKKEIDYYNLDFYSREIKKRYEKGW